MNYFRALRYFDWVTFFLMFALMCCGLVCILSATYSAKIPYSLFFKKQLIGCLSGIVIYILFCFIDYRRLSQWGHLLYIFLIGLLLFTLVKGSIGMGAQRWINLGFVKFQPSELTKLFLPAFIITYLHHSYADYTQVQQRDLMSLLAIIGVSALLVAKQPDLGTGILIAAAGTCMVWCAGINKKIFLLLVALFCLCLPLSWKLLKPYQKQRIAVFFGEGEARKERYQLEQGIIAIGSGGLTGKGYLRGTQNILMFLPERRTDFIFAILCEEWGFVGACAVIILYLLLFLRLMYITWSITSFYPQLLCFGLWIHIIFGAFVNMSMVMGMLPIVGIPLPLMSYGITNLWTTCASLGWIQGIHIKRNNP
ncbi:MAG: rod shape-determining protein RodA [Candidatus Babeliales bacterium]